MSSSSSARTCCSPSWRWSSPPGRASPSRRRPYTCRSRGPRTARKCPQACRNPRSSSTAVWLSGYIAAMRFFATCAKGTEGALRRELSALKLRHVRGGQGGVAFEGGLEAAMRACLHARVAMRVVLELASFPADDADALYEGVRAVDWTPWLTARTTLAVEATVRDSGITHSGFAALKVKDAVVDALRDKLGARPDVDPKDPDVRIVLHLARDPAALGLDLAGEPLHKRGYRSGATPAPLKETLAASVLALGRGDLERP